MKLVPKYQTAWGKMPLVFNDKGRRDWAAEHATELPEVTVTAPRPLTETERRWKRNLTDDEYRILRDNLHKSLLNAIKGSTIMGLTLMGGENSALPYGFGLVDIATGVGSLEDMARGITRSAIPKARFGRHLERIALLAMREMRMPELNAHNIYTGDSPKYTFNHNTANTTLPTSNLRLIGYLPKVTGPFNEYIPENWDSVPQFMDQAAYNELVKQGFNPSTENLVNSVELIKQRTPNPSIPYDLVETIYVPEQYGGFKFYAAADPGKVYIPEGAGFKTNPNRQSFYNTTYGHELVHATGFPSKENYTELLRALTDNNELPVINRLQYILDYINSRWESYFLKNNEALISRGEAPLTFEEFKELVSPYLETSLNGVISSWDDNYFLNILPLYLYYKNKGGNISMDTFNYLVRTENGTEIDARLSLLLNYLGATSDNVGNVTGSTLQNAMLAYPGDNNNMAEFYDLLDKTNAWERIAKLVRERKYGKMVIPGIGLAAYSNE